MRRTQRTLHNNSTSAIVAISNAFSAIGNVQWKRKTSTTILWRTVRPLWHLFWVVDQEFWCECVCVDVCWPAKSNFFGLRQKQLVLYLYCWKKQGCGGWSREELEGVHARWRPCNSCNVEKLRLQHKPSQSSGDVHTFLQTNKPDVECQRQKWKNYNSIVWQNQRRQRRPKCTHVSHRAKLTIKIELVLSSFIHNVHTNERHRWIGVTRWRSRGSYKM